MKVSFNPINNPVNIELIRENFETRCITYQKRRIVKKADLNPLIIYENEKPYDEEAWKYLQEDSIEIDSSFEEKKLEENYMKEEKKESIEKMDLVEETKKNYKKHFMFNEKFVLEKKCYLLKKLYPNFYQEKETKIYSHMLKVSSRFSKKKLRKFTNFIQNIKKCDYINQTINANNQLYSENDSFKFGITIEFLINSILLLFQNKQASIISSINDIRNYFFVDSNQSISTQLFEEVLILVEKINFLRNIDKKFDELNIQGNFTQSLIAFINEFMQFFDFTIGNLLKIFNHQLGKISKSQMNNDFQYHFEKILKDNFKYTKPLFIFLLNKHKEYITKLNQLTLNGKINIIKVFLYISKPLLMNISIFLYQFIMN